MFILGLGASVIYLLALLIISQSDDDMEIIRNLLFVIILNMFFVMNTIHLNGVVQVFMDTKTRNMLEVLSEKSKVVMPALDQDNSCSSLINHEVKLEEEGASFPDESLQETENISHLGHVELDSSFDSFHYDDIPWNNSVPAIYYFCFKLIRIRCKTDRKAVTTHQNLQPANNNICKII